jgi:hypothetical protein
MEGLAELQPDCQEDTHPSSAWDSATSRAVPQGAPSSSPLAATASQRGREPQPGRSGGDDPKQLEQERSCPNSSPRRHGQLEDTRRRPRAVGAPGPKRTAQKKRENACATASLSLLLAATAGQQGREEQDKDDPKQRRRRDQLSPKPTTEASQRMTKSLKRSPPLQIVAISSRSSRIPSYLVTTTSSKRDLGIPSMGPRPITKTGLIGRAPAGSGPGRRPPWREGRDPTADRHRPSTPA